MQTIDQIINMGLTIFVLANILWFHYCIDKLRCHADARVEYDLDKIVSGISKEVHSIMNAADSKIQSKFDQVDNKIKDLEEQLKIDRKNMSDLDEGNGRYALLIDARINSLIEDHIKKINLDQSQPKGKTVNIPIKPKMKRGRPRKVVDGSNG